VNNINFSNKLNYTWLMILFGELRPAGTYPHVSVSPFLREGDEASELHVRSLNVTAATPLDYNTFRRHRNLFQRKKKTIASDHVPNYPVGLLLLSPVFPIFKENVRFLVLIEMKRNRVMLRNFVADGSNCVMDGASF